MEGGTEKAVEGDQEEVAVATSEFTADEEKPWEISVRKGSLLNVLESKKKWWKVRVNDGTGYVPEECVKLLKPAVSSASQPVQSGSKRPLETDHQTESQPLHFIDENTMENERTSEEQRTEHFDSNRPGPDVQLIHTDRMYTDIPRRRSSRLAGKQEKAHFKKSKVEWNKYPSVDLTWKAAMERAQQNNSATTDIFNTINKGGRTPHGPRDIIKAPGLNKISVFPDIALKIEKVEPFDEETENHPSSPISVSCSEPLSESHLEFETRVVKEEVDLEDFPRDQYATPCQDDSEDTASSCVLESTPIQTPAVSVYKEEVVQEDLQNEQCVDCCPGESETSRVELSESPYEDHASCNSFVSPTLSAKSMHSNIFDKHASPLIDQPSLENSKQIDSPVTYSGIVTIVATVSSHTSLDNSSNPCCVLFGEVLKVLVMMGYPKAGDSDDDDSDDDDTDDSDDYDSDDDDKNIVETTRCILLSWRFVCKDWRKGVDKCLENLSVALQDPTFHLKELGHQRKTFRNQTGCRRYFPKTCEALDFNSRSKIGRFRDCLCISIHSEFLQKLCPSEWQAFNFNSSSKIEYFLNHFKDTHSALGPLSVQWKNNKNPVLGRFVSIDGRMFDSMRPQKMISSVTELLRKYGSHIWYSKISFGTGFLSIESLLLCVLEWLQLMPNLKHFTWKTNFLNESYLAILATGRHTFSNLKSLKRVVLRRVPNEIPRQFFLGNYYTDRLYSTPFVNEPMKLSNLKELNLTLRTVNEFAIFEIFKHHWPMLEELQLNLYNDTNADITWRRVMKALEHWKNTLKYVSIYLPTPRCPENSIHDYDSKRLPYRLDLPRVKYLKMNFAKGFASLNKDASLDFLSPLRESLEDLHLAYHSDYEYPENFCILRSWLLPHNKQIPFHFGHKTNIWSVFLKLKNVYVERYDRQDSLRCIPTTYYREPQTKNFELDERYYRQFFPHDYLTVKNPKVVNRECRMAAADLFRAWQSLNNTDVDVDREKNLKQSYLKSIKQFAREGIYTSLLVYKYSNPSPGNPQWCWQCEEIVGKVDVHFWETHFLYAGKYKCDFAECEEMFSSKYNVVKHRISWHEQEVFYDPEAIPVHNLPLPEMKQIFNWIHVDAPQGFLENGHWPSRLKKCRCLNCRYYK